MESNIVINQPNSDSAYGATNNTIKVIHSKNEVARITDTVYSQSEITLISEYGMWPAYTVLYGGCDIYI
jgi:hypothetical protein